MTQWSWSMITQTFIQWKQIVSSLSIILGTHRVPPSSATAPRHSINSTITTTVVTSIEQMNRRTELPTTKETTTDPTTIIMGIITVMLLCRHNTKTRLKSRVKNKVMNTAGLRIGEASFSIAGIINPFGAVGKYIYHFFFVKFLGLEGKRNPKYFQT